MSRLILTFRYRYFLWWRFQCFQAQGLHRNRYLQKTIHGPNGIKSVTAMGVGTMARLDGIVPSNRKRNNWQNGIATIYYNDEYESMSLVPIEDGRMVLDGQLMEGEDRTEELAAQIPWRGFAKEAVA